MSITQSVINSFLKEQVKNGSCSSVDEAEQQLTSKLAEMRLDKNIKEGREDVKMGRCEPLTDDWIKNFTLESKKKLFGTTKKTNVQDRNLKKSKSRFK